MLINFAIGVVTGIVQEFQFGMNWSTYSRYVGDIFGAPLAMEGLAAFFLESTFLGLWIFGWGRLGRRLHLATIYIVAFGTTLSAYFILAANSWMQHPVGYKIDHATGHARMTSILAGADQLDVRVRLPAHDRRSGDDRRACSSLGVVRLASAPAATRRPCSAGRSRRRAAGASLVASLLTTFVGHGQAQLMTKQQPMKMAAAEALYTTRTCAPFSLFAVAPFEEHPTRSSFDVRLPNMLSVLATNSFDGKVEGINTIQARYQARYGPGDYRPVIGVTYWTFRIMTGLGFALIAIAAFGMWLVWRGRLDSSRRFLRLCTYAIALPLLANTAGWIFTEMGRQPWVVQGLLLTAERRLAQRAGLGGRHHPDRIHAPLRRAGRGRTAG